MSIWPGNKEKMTPYNNLKLSFSERPWDVGLEVNFVSNQ